MGHRGRDGHPRLRAENGRPARNELVPGRGGHRHRKDERSPGGKRSPLCLPQPEVPADLGLQRRDDGVRQRLGAREARRARGPAQAAVHRPAPRQGHPRQLPDSDGPYHHRGRKAHRQQAELCQCHLPVRRPLPLLYRRGVPGADRPDQGPGQHHLGHAQETLPHQAGREGPCLQPLGQQGLDPAGQLQRQDPPPEHHGDGNLPHLRDELDSDDAQRGSVPQRAVPGRLCLLRPQGDRGAPGQHRSGTWNWKRRWTSPSASRPSGTPP